MASISEQLSSVIKKHTHKVLPISSKLKLLKNFEVGKDQEGMGKDKKEMEGVGKGWRGQERHGRDGEGREWMGGGGKGGEGTGKG